MTHPLISVLIPAYNRATTLEQCVRSAQAGGHDRLEIIISDNASTDETLAVAQRLAEEDNRIVVLSHASNRGPIANWRACLERASGEWVHWLWSDDWVEPGFYATMLASMATRNARVGFCAAKVVEPTSGIWHISGSMPDAGQGREELLTAIFRGGAISVSPAAALLPMDSVRRHFTASIPVVSGLECNLRAIGCDVIMIMGAIWDTGVVAFCPQPLVNFRISPSSISCSTDKRLLSVHYAWARIYWGRTHGLPRKWMLYDYARLIRGGRFAAAVRGLC